MDDGGINILSRYVSLDRFRDMCAQGLFLANPTLFKDPQEGCIAVKSIFPNIDELNLRNIEIMKSYFYVNSWYGGGERPKAMWERFGEICIETSYERLKNICRKYGENNPTHNIIIGKVQYVSPSMNGLGDRKPDCEWDYWSEKNYNPQCGFNFCSIKTLQGLFFKYDNFSDEKEVRLICDSYHGCNKVVSSKNDKTGVRVSLNNDFFLKIVLSVENSKILKNCIEDILKRYGYEAIVACSN